MGRVCLGEAPFLAGQMAAAQITGTQSGGTMSQVKHFAGYDGATMLCALYLEDDGVRAGLLRGHLDC